MPAPHLTRKDERALEAKLNQAVSAINQGYLAWEATGRSCAGKMVGKSIPEVMKAAAQAYPDHHLLAVSHAQRTIAAQLARFEDGPGYNLDLCQEHTLNPLANYEEMAANLLEDIAYLKGDRQEEAIKTPTGKWAVSRSLSIKGQTYSHAALCTNTAVGTQELDDWESRLRASELFQTCEAAQTPAL